MSDTSRDLSLLDPQLRTAWEIAQLEWAERHPWPGSPKPFVTATYRGPKDQQAAFESGASRFLYGESLHNFKPAYAFDVAFLSPSGQADWSPKWFQKMADILEPLGLEWGGRWPGLIDGPHFQLPMTAKDAREGKVPQLPELQPGGSPTIPDDGWKVVVLQDSQITHVLDVRGRDVVARVAPEFRRIYIDIRKDKGA